MSLREVCEESHIDWDNLNKEDDWGTLKKEYKKPSISSYKAFHKELEIFKLKSGTIMSTFHHLYNK